MIKLTAKELKRVSSDGFVIISRPDATKGGYNVMAIRVEDLHVIGWPQHVDSKMHIAGAATHVQRDLDKFLGVGGKMSSKGRMRPGIKQNKARAANVE